MYGVELYAAVRLAVVDEGLSHHEAGRRFGIDRRTVKKMLSYSAPPGYRRTKPVRRPKLDGLTGIIDAILEADMDPDVPRQAAAHGAPDLRAAARRARVCTGSYTIVKDYVRSRRQTTREAFVPLHHPPGHAQVDFGEAVVGVAGATREGRLLLPDPAAFERLVRRRPTLGRRRRRFWTAMSAPSPSSAGFPRSILYDNTTLAVARILGDGTRQPHPGVHASAVALPVPRPLRPAGQGQRQGQGRGPGEDGAAQVHGADPEGAGAGHSERAADGALPGASRRPGGGRQGGGAAGRPRGPARSARPPPSRPASTCRARSRPRRWCATVWWTTRRRRCTPTRR